MNIAILLEKHKRWMAIQPDIVGAILFASLDKSQMTAETLPQPEKNNLEVFRSFEGITHVSRSMNLKPMIGHPTTSNDEELLRLIAAGDETAFTTLYRRHHPQLYRFALLMSGSATMAEEVTQEVFLVLIREAHRYDATRGTLVAYLYGIARIHVLRSQERSHLNVPLLEAVEEGASVSPLPLIARDDPFGDCARNEVIERVRNAVLGLPPRYREVVVLCDFQELSYAEAARVLDCAVGTICSRLHRGHTLLLERLRAMDSAQLVRCTK